MGPAAMTPPSASVSESETNANWQSTPQRRRLSRGASLLLVQSGSRLAVSC
jgi:hypothetical protein